jgi:hypothetical protein
VRRLLVKAAAHHDRRDGPDTHARVGVVDRSRYAYIVTIITYPRALPISRGARPFKRGALVRPDNDSKEGLRGWSVLGTQIRL